MQEIGKSRGLDLFFWDLGGFCEDASVGLGLSGRQKSARSVFEFSSDKITGFNCKAHPFSVAGRCVKFECRLSHGQCVAEERSAAIGVAMSESATCEFAVLHNPICALFAASSASSRPWQRNS